MSGGLGVSSINTDKLLLAISRTAILLSEQMTLSPEVLSSKKKIEMVFKRQMKKVRKHQKDNTGDFTYGYFANMSANEFNMLKKYY